MNVHIGRTILADTFLWDTSSENSVTPEEFANQLTAELGLGGDFRTMIALSIREQVLRHTLAPSDSAAATVGNIDPALGFAGCLRPIQEESSSRSSKLVSCLLNV